MKTVDKWIVDNYKTLNTTTWLKYDKVDREYVATLKCSVCFRFKNKLCSARNYSPAFVVCSTSLRASAFKEHAESDMHQRTMTLLKKSQGSVVVEYAPIAEILSTLDDNAERKLKRKFEIAYFLCKQNLSFTKMAPLCTLEEKHGIDLGSGYKNNKACATFVEYIAQQQRELLTSTLAKAKFFSIQTDGSTDVSNVGNKLFLALYLYPHAPDGKVDVRSRFLSVRQPKCADAKGLFECFTRALDHVGIVGWDEKLIGFGCDSTSVNIYELVV